MRLLVVVIGLSVVGFVAACGSAVSTCVPGMSSACVCTGGTTGSQVCAANGTYDACNCGTGGGAGGGAGGGGGGGAVCSPANCTGCCTATGTCAVGNNNSTCGTAGNACVACSANQSCVNYVCIVNPKRIFVTVSTFTGNLGGLAGADAKCNTAAQGAALGGTWKAWLSDATANAADRIVDVGPWHLVAGAKVFNNKANLMTLPLVAVNKTEQGQFLGFNTEVWTGTASGGQKHAQTCSSWTSSSDLVFGRTGRADLTAEWTEQSTGDMCDGLLHLYCLEQ